VKVKHLNDIQCPVININRIWDFLVSKPNRCRIIAAAGVGSWSEAARPRKPADPRQITIAFDGEVYFMIRGLMVDQSRQIERPKFYFDLLDHMARWGMNTLWWHFADDQGFHLKLDSHPEIASPYAFTKSQMQAFIDKAGMLGIDVVPEVEALGHTRYITALPQYAHLCDGDPTLYNAICPSHPQTMPLLEEIIREVASIFPSQYLHAGLDEVSVAGCPRCGRKNKGQAHWWGYAQHTLAIHKVVRDCGKRMILWADHVEKAPAMLDVLPKDIILAQWQYTDIRPDAFERAAKAGFESIAAPAMSHWWDLVHANAQNFQNVDDMASIAAGDPKTLGVVNTWWISWRGLRDAYLPAIFHTGKRLQSKSSIDTVATMREYVKDMFDLTDPAVGMAIATLHQRVLQGEREMAQTWATPADMHVAAMLAGEADFADSLTAVEQAKGVLEAAAPKVQRHKAEFKSLVLAADVDYFGLQHAASARELYRLLLAAEIRWHRGASPQPERQEIVKLLAGRLRQAERIVRLVEKDWDRTRYADDPKKHMHDLDAPCEWDAMLGKLARCKAYLESISGDLSLLSPCFREVKVARKSAGSAGGSKKRGKKSQPKAKSRR
jgi:hypothetical protein